MVFIVNLIYLWAVSVKLAAFPVFEIHASILSLHMQFSTNFVIIRCQFFA